MEGLSRDPASKALRNSASALDLPNTSVPVTVRPRRCEQQRFFGRQSVAERGGGLIEFSGACGHVARNIPHQDATAPGEAATHTGPTLPDPQSATALAPVVAGVHTLHDFRRDRGACLREISHACTPQERLLRSLPRRSAPPWCQVNREDVDAPAQLSRNGTSGQGPIAVVGRSRSLWHRKQEYQPTGRHMNFRALLGVCCGTVYVCRKRSRSGLGRRRRSRSCFGRLEWGRSHGPNCNVDSGDLRPRPRLPPRGCDFGACTSSTTIWLRVMTEGFLRRCEALKVVQQQEEGGRCRRRAGRQAAAQGIPFIASSGDPGCRVVRCAGLRCGDARVRR